MCVKTSLLVVVCAIAATGVLAGCVTQNVAPNNTSATTAVVSSHGPTIRGEPTAAHAKPASYRVAIDTTTVYAEAPTTLQEQEQGLMNRTHLDANAGMLFPFTSVRQQSIWMKNMRLPIDIVFITADKHVLEVYRSVPPCAREPCPLYTSSAPVRYALEVNAGFCARHGIVSGMPVSIAEL
jgi:uncharacterized membrane protein (UPF0127 family)